MVPFLPPPCRWLFHIRLLETTARPCPFDLLEEPVGSDALHPYTRSLRDVARGAALAVPVASLVAVLAISCLGDSSSPRSAVANLVLAPSFESAAAAVVDIASVRVLLERTADLSVALDTTVQVQPNDSVVDLNLSVLINSDVETLWLTLECYTLAGELVFVGGPVEVTATAEDQGEPSAVDVVVEYVGSGSDAAAVHIITQDAAIFTGETVILAAEALDTSQVPIAAAPIFWTSLDVQRALVPDPTVGLVVGGAERGSARIEASLLTGQSDTAIISVLPVPTAIEVASGDEQLGVVETRLPLPLAVQVTALDGLGVSGATVDFSTVDGGSFDGTPAVTDSAGLASADWILGLSEGIQTATASLSGFGNPSVTFSATAESFVPASGDVLVLSNFAAANASIVDSFPQYMPGLTFDSMNVSVQTPTVAFMSQYSVVLLFEDGLFANALNVGDSVAAYVQAGGNLVLGTFYWQDRSDNQVYTTRGWGALEEIDPFLGPQGSEYRADSLDATSIVEHPITQGVDSLWVSSSGGYHGGVIAKPGTTVLARWSDACDYCETALGSPLVGFRIEANGQRIVGVTVGPGYPYYGGYGGDFYKLFENALGWAAGGSQPLPAASPIVRSHPAPESAGVGIGGGGSNRGNR
jgi:hypothetical protein